MRRETIKITTLQTIHYEGAQTTEQYDYQTEAVLLELESYHKLTYQDEQGNTIEWKWQPDYDPSTTVIMKQSGYQLYFNPQQTTETLYQTPQGYWQLAVTTHTCRWQFGVGSSPKTSRYQLDIAYELHREKEKLGDYRFRLIFEA